jgi:hypothetical protein
VDVQLKKKKKKARNATLEFIVHLLEYNAVKYGKCQSTFWKKLIDSTVETEEYAMQETSMKQKASNDMFAPKQPNKSVDSMSVPSVILQYTNILRRKVKML